MPNTAQPTGPRTGAPRVGEPGAGEPVAVVGLGDLGLAIASRLVALGTQTIGVDASEQRRALWRERTGRDALLDAGELAGLDVGSVFVCVRMTDQVAQVLSTLGGLPAAQRLVAYVVSTLEPSFARDLGARASGRMRTIELPVSGGRGAAERGELTVMVGGDQARPQEVAFLEATLARRVFTFAGYGEATVAKLVNNTLGAFNACAFARCIALADAAGVDAATCAELVRSSSGSSWMAENFGELLDELLMKDAGLLAAELGPLPVIDLAAGEELLAALAGARRLIAAPARRGEQGPRPGAGTLTSAREKV
ncbi:MAG: NAD(P)-binding domain-containing protein [Solirubrobacteraceae bacterium]